MAGNFCTQCGEPLEGEELRFCTHCGHTETDPDAKFCRYCGTMLSKSQPSGWINDFFSGE